VWEQRERYCLKGSQFSWEHKSMNSKDAMSLVEKAFLEIHDSVWVPQHDFDFAGVIQLMHKGHSLDEIKRMISEFNERIKQKISTRINVVT
jgi:p-methyltransferase